MPTSRYEPIYRRIKREIEDGTHSFGDFLPSENAYAARFSCSRNTVRRALSLLTSEGYLLPQHGRGVEVIYRNDSGKSLFSIGGIESFSEAAERNGLSFTTEVITFETIKADNPLSMMSGFDAGTELFHIERLRRIKKKAIILDENWFLCSEASGLTEEIAAKSIYTYLETELGMNITTSKRRVTAEKATDPDRKHLDLHGLDFVLVVSGQVFNSRGVMFEYTQSRHVPDQVCFIESAVRQHIT
ncbi:MAG: UTRA domain-containing protein [Solobacterium sp.]|nr:UTRA domain-containing protein [Solobacterium sp.]